MKNKILLYLEGGINFYENLQNLLASLGSLRNNSELYMVFISKDSDEQGKLQAAGLKHIFVLSVQKNIYYDVPKLIFDINEKIKPGYICSVSNAVENQNLGYLAGMLNNSIITNCKKIDRNDDSVYLYKEMFGNKATCEIKCPAGENPIIFTFQKSGIDRNHHSINETSPFETRMEHIDSNNYISKKISIKEFICRKNNDVPIDNADIVIGIGRGVKRKEDIGIFSNVLNNLKASLGGSRGVVDQGFLDESQQIGQTGKTIKAKMYIAVGISGSPQHIFGMKDSRKIIAINKDPDANIFKYADIGIIGDLYEIIPALDKLLGSRNKS